MLTKLRPSGAINRLKNNAEKSKLCSMAEGERRKIRRCDNTDKKAKREIESERDRALHRSQRLEHPIPTYVHLSAGWV